MRYLIAMPLELSQAEDFIKLRDQYKGMAPRWKITLGPHITIFRPSEFKLDKNEAIRVFKSAPGFGRFNQQFDGFEAFLNYSNNAVYSEPLDYQKFHDIKAAYEAVAQKILQDTTEVWPFHPHLTLVNRLDEGPARQLLQKLEAVKFEKKYDFSKICLYKKDKGDPLWVEIACNRLA